MRKCWQRDTSVSLHPLSFEELIGALVTTSKHWPLWPRSPTKPLETTLDLGHECSELAQKFDDRLIETLEESERWGGLKLPSAPYPPMWYISTFLRA